jgi:phosphonate degradation associated HDIG domain protein
LQQAKAMPENFHPPLDDLQQMMLRRGGERYSGEPVSHLEHAMQCAEMARQSGASSALIAAALLHDVGHLLSHLPGTPSQEGINDHHEYRGAHALSTWFPKSVTEPIRLHVKAKRYLATDATYFALLSEDSKRSLHLQGGIMAHAEKEAFEQHEFHQAALQLRRIDDLAKNPQLATSTWNDYWQIALSVRSD